MGRLAALALAVVALGAATPTSGATGPTSLKVTYWEDGSKAISDEVWTLRCNPARGSLPRPARACRKLAAGGTKLFAPLPPDSVCTEIYGGPQRARVVGTVAGKRVQATFSRTDGCQVAHWSALSPWLLPLGGVR